MTVIIAPLCMNCQFFKPIKDNWHCDAFPKGIPQDIITSEFDHHNPHEGDHGIQFKEMPEDHTQKDEFEQITCGQGRFL